MSYKTPCAKLAGNTLRIPLSIRRTVFLGGIASLAFGSAASAQSLLTYDLEVPGQWNSNFRVLSAIGGGSAAQTTVSSNGVFRQDATTGSNTGVYLFDQTPSDTSLVSQSSFNVAGPLTVAMDARAAITGSSFTVYFADPANVNNNVIAIFNINTGADQVRFFRDGMPGNAGVGSQVGSSSAPVTAAEPGGANFVNFSVRLTVSGTTPTLTVVVDGNSYTSSFSSGDFNWSRTLVALRLFDGSLGVSPLDIDNLIFTSPAPPESPVQPNTAPIAPTIANRIWPSGVPLYVSNAFSDGDVPAQTLTYQLTQAPGGSTISSAGLITWIPPVDLVGQTVTITTTATDNGFPVLSSTSSFTVTVAPPLTTDPNGYATLIDFETSTGFTQNFRVSSKQFGNGTARTSGGVFSLDAVNADFATGENYTLDTTPSDPRTATQLAFPVTSPITVSMDFRAQTAGASFAIFFSNPYDHSRNVLAYFTVQAGADRIRFYRGLEGGYNGVQVGSDISQTVTGAEPSSGAFVRLTATLTVSGTTPTITLKVGDGPTVSSAFSAGDFDWSQTLVSFRLFDSGVAAGDAVQIDNFSIVATQPAIPGPPPGPVPPVIPTQTVQAPGTNLLGVNPGFESAAFSTTTENSAFILPGWEGIKYTSASTSVAAVQSGTVTAGSTTEGARRFRFDWGGRLSTAPADRPVAVPARNYEMSVDLRSLVRNFPSQRLGTLVALEFFDAAGTRLKQYYGPNWRPQVQSTNKDVWETFTVRGTAPAGSASVGVRIDAPAGQFISSTEDYVRNRHIEIDRVRLIAIGESLDRLAIRRAPRLLQPGDLATIRVRYAATANRSLAVSLRNAAGQTVVIGGYDVPAGRGLQDVRVTLPATLANGTYVWEAALLPIGGAWPQAVAQAKISDVFADDTVSLSTAANGTDFPGDHPNIVYMGRIENTLPAKPWLHWYGSEVRVRFSGTSLALRGSAGPNGFGGATPANIYVVIDGDEWGGIPIALNSWSTSSTFNFPLVTGLADGIHTARIFKSGETNEQFRVDGFRVDPGRGLLRPEPLPARKIEIYGDSVTSGGNANPTYFGYPARLGRELDADVHIISKGGTGLAASFGGQDKLINYWDNLTFPNTGNASTGLPWNFSTWKPDAVLIATGHNDQFNGGAGPPFRTKYAEFHGLLRSTYGPDLTILALNTIISNPIAHFEAAIEPLLAIDPKLRWVHQRSSSAPVGSHPGTFGHRVMIEGDATRFSFADVVEDLENWGVDGPLSSYEAWTTVNFSLAQRAEGLHAQGLSVAGTGESNLLRYALGATPTGPVALPTATRDAEGKLNFSFFRAEDDVSYGIEISEDLFNWSTAAVNPGSVGQHIKWTDAEARARRFARLGVNPR